jgi:hypothetical protein
MYKQQSMSVQIHLVNVLDALLMLTTISLLTQLIAVCCYCDTATVILHYYCKQAAVCTIDTDACSRELSVCTYNGWHTVLPV